jgi:PPOX class probable F420-dependent enzyme
VDGMTTTLAIPETHHDLLTRSTVALSTLNPDGSIQTTAVWVFLEADGTLRMSLATNRQKYRNLVREPRATVFALDPQNPFRFLEVRAAVTIEPDTDKSFLRKVFTSYDTDPASMPGLLDEDRVVVTFRPERVIAQ